MFILRMSCFLSPYFASKSSSKIASSNVFEHSRPMFNVIRRATLPALRCFIAGGDDDWHDMPTTAMRSSPFSRSAYAIRCAPEPDAPPAFFETVMRHVVRAYGAARPGRPVHVGAVRSHAGDRLPRRP